MFKIILMIVILILIFIGLYIYNAYQKMKDLSDNINTSKEKIKELLDKKLDLMEKLAKNSKDKDLKVMLKKETNSIFEMEDMLYNARWKLENLINNNKYEPKDEFRTYFDTLKGIEEEIEGLKDYYNSKVVIYNELFNVKVLNNMYKLLKLENQKKFKLRKIESYEILKD